MRYRDGKNVTGTETTAYSIVTRFSITEFGS